MKHIKEVSLENHTPFLEALKTKMNESFLSPGELKKKLQRVAARWASIKGVKFEEAYNELRKKKSVKDMLDFYSVDEIIDDLKAELETK